jgi:hypothetical protein
MRGEDGQLETLGKFRGMIRGNGRLLNGHDAALRMRTCVTQPTRWVLQLEAPRVAVS